jgi:tRNA modification GTPase
MQDTIVAIATPIGRSGIGVIRLSGSDSLVIARKFFNQSDFEPEPRKAYLKKIIEPETKELIDETIVTYFQSPHSFTGEDVVEIDCHGSPVLLRQIIDLCLQHNARLAEAGEFTLRALANGRMNLSQAEAIRDLIDAQTIGSARLAIRQLRGEFSTQLQPLKDDLLNVIVILESAIEFVEDDLPEFQNTAIKESLTTISKRLSDLSATFKAGKLLRDGLKIAFIGRPNVGKSSLFNTLLGQERAIVTNIAGTTRDSLHERLVINNIPISLIDTAGLRETTELVESIGVERTKQTLADADLVVIVLDNSECLQKDDFDIFEQTKDLQHIIVVNKIDVDSNIDLRGFDASVVEVSAKTGQGISNLERAIVKPFELQDVENKGFLVSDARHFDLLNRANNEIQSTLLLLDSNASEEIVVIGLHNAIRLLGQITGETTTEDMLTRIFSTFCIGK